MKTVIKILFIIILIIITILIILHNKTKKYIDSFIVTVDEVILGNNCPDYSVFDGYNYYLIFNNKEFDGVNNPLFYDSKEKMITKLNELKCPVNHYIKNLIVLRRNTNHDDPHETIERKCNKHISLNNYSIDKCAFNFAYGDSTNLNKEFININTDELSKISDETLDKLEPKMKTMGGESLDNYKMIRQLVDFINQNDESIMVNYDLETCMYEKIGDIYKNEENTNPEYLQKQEIGSKNIIHKFRKHFGADKSTTYENIDIENEITDTGYLDEESMGEFIKYFETANNVISDDIINTLFEN